MYIELANQLVTGSIRHSSPKEAFDATKEVDERRAFVIVFFADGTQVVRGLRSETDVEQVQKALMSDRVLRYSAFTVPRWGWRMYRIGESSPTANYMIQFIDPYNLHVMELIRANEPGSVQWHLLTGYRGKRTILMSDDTAEVLEERDPGMRVLGTFSAPKSAIEGAIEKQNLLRDAPPLMEHALAIVQGRVQPRRRWFRFGR